MSAFFQFLSDLPVVVDLAVENDPLGFVRIMYRLLAARKIYDREAAHRQTDVFVYVNTIFIGAAVDDRAVHRLEQSSVDCIAVGVYVSGNSTHLIYSVTAVRVRMTLSTRLCAVTRMIRLFSRRSW